MKRVIASGFLLVLALCLLPAWPTAAQNGSSDDEIKAILQDRVDCAKKSVGIVVGIIDDKGARIISYGKPTKDSTETVNGDSIFEIGSISKVFTATLLADMVERGEVSLDDPISKYLPKSVKTPTRNGKEITLLYLSSQSSGLPRMPDNFRPKDSSNPYADYTVEQMYQFISGYTLTRDIGSKYEYSNLGVGLLGHILALRAGTDYETLVQTRITEPLKMKNTRIKFTPEMQAHLAHGHNERLEPVANWDIPTLAGAGALRSSANDLLKFLQANMGLTPSPLLKAMQFAHQPRQDTEYPNLKVGLGWHILKKYDSEIVWHNGGTGGYRTFIGFDRQKRRGVVVLANASNGADDIGYHLINSQFPLAKFEPPREHKAIKLDAKILDSYVGEYQLAPNLLLKFTREGEQFFVETTSRGKLEIFPESESEFFLKVVDEQLTFVKDAQGRVTGLVLHQQNGQNPTAPKIK